MLKTQHHECCCTCYLHIILLLQILLRNRATNLNARMHDGTTPLILAARLAIEGMVEDLINADADINAADNSGKTALHWGAAVNNVDAVNILLSHGANRDAQDDKVLNCCGMLPSFHSIKGLVSITSCSGFVNFLQYPIVAHCITSLCRHICDISGFLGCDLCCWVGGSCQTF